MKLSARLKVIWFIGFIDPNNMKLASQFNYVTDKSQNLNIRARNWNYQEHRNFTCVLYFPSINSNQISFMQAIYIEVIDHKRKLKAGLMFNRGKCQISVNYVFQPTEIDFRRLKVYCVKNMKSSMDCEEIARKLRNDYIELTTLPGVPLTLETALMDSELELTKQFIKNEFKRFCSESICEINNFSFHLHKNKLQKKRIFLKECLSRLGDFLGFDSLGIFEFCDAFCVDFDGNCIWKYIFSDEHIRNLYPQISHYLTISIEILSEKRCTTIQNDLKEFQWDFHNFFNGFVKRKEYMKNSIDLKHSYISLRPILCIEEVKMSNLYKWKEYEISSLGDFTILFQHWSGLLNLEIQIWNDADLVILIRRSNVNKESFEINIQNEICTMTLPISEDSYTDKKIGFIITTINNTHTKVLFYIEGFTVSSYWCTFGRLNIPLTITSILFTSLHHTKISNFQIFPYKIENELLNTYNITIQCFEHLRNVLYKWPYKDSEIQKFDKKIVPRCPGLCDETSFCFICAINTTDICNLRQSEHHLCLKGALCNGGIIKIGKVYLKDNNKVIMCDQLNYERNYEVNDYLELFTISLVPKLVHCYDHIQMKTNKIAMDCPPGKYKYTENLCKNCPDGYYNFGDANELGCQKCPILRSFKFNEFNSILDCSNEMERDILTMVIDNPVKFLYLMKENQFSSYIIKDDPDQLLEMVGFFDITSPEIERKMMQGASFTEEEIKILKSKKGLYLSNHDLRMFLILGFFLAAVTMLLFALLFICIFNIIWASLVRGIKRLFKLAGFFLKFTMIKTKTRYYFFRVRMARTGGLCINLLDWLMNIFANLLEKIKRIFMGPPMKLRKTIGYFFFWKIPKAKRKKVRKEEKIKDDTENESSSNSDSENDNSDRK